jgi:hypothetical protein
MTIRQFAVLILVFLAGFGVANRGSPRTSRPAAETVPRTIHVTHPGRTGAVHSGTSLVVDRVHENNETIYERTTGRIGYFRPVWKVALGDRVFICVETER